MSTQDVDVIIIGAGISGIGAARELEGTGRTVRILEARDGVGGTWDLFRYPGIRSDSDMATFGYRSRPWTGERSLAQGESIREYVRAAAEEAGVLGQISFGQRALRAEWSSDTHTWTVTHEDVHTGATSTLAGRWLFMATGYYRYDEGFTPAWPTLSEFRGTVVHPQHWPEDLDVAGKRVVVVGSGATAVTLVPALTERGARVSMLQRSPTYVAAVSGRDRTGVRLRRWLPPRVAGEANRWRNILRGMAVYEFSRRRPRAMRALLHRGAVKHLGPTFPVDEHFTPEYDPWDQRLCAAPDGDFFRAVRGDRAEVVTDTIERFTPDGVDLTSGRHLAADVLVTATGLNVQFLGAAELVVDGEPVDPAEHVSYRGMMLDGVPNMAFAIGYTNSSWTLRVDLVTGYFHRLLDRMDREGAVAVTPRYSGPRAGLRPLIDLAAGYIQRGAHLLPRQGPDGAWNVRQNYLRDRVLFRPGAERDEQLEFTVPAPRAAGVTP
ncbi:NAD(P)/FAD-dependent oxidoreductase [Kocuria sp.]|uniref:flavin-containing monooxygenase n=1 Tax=Kocuria sp. TaxID=1871328 RepID=UPI0026DCA373|nr:NAD(P)/FAD-dependent oxidoreductase [Kocuria sp.]MDO4918894.1 NAD(P)/FAD-dependent oxidoreductase [Kocuria sp.]